MGSTTSTFESRNDLNLSDASTPVSISSGMKGSTTPHPLRQQSHHPPPGAGQPQQPLMPPGAGGPGAPGGDNTPLTPMMASTAIKQEGSSGDLMVPGHTHLGSPDTVSQYVDSTTYPSRLTPPEFNAMQEELLNGRDISEVLTNSIFEAHSRTTLQR